LVVELPSLFKEGAGGGCRSSPMFLPGRRVKSRESARPALDVPLPIFKIRPFNAFGALAKRVHLLSLQGLELLGEANVVL